MIPTISHLDQKFRLPVPSAIRPIFKDSIVHCTLRTHSLLIGPQQYNEVGSHENKIDKSGRILIGKDLLSILGVQESDPKSREVLWIPYGTKDKVEFLVFFGTPGQESWKKILATKTIVKQLIHT